MILKGDDQKEQFKVISITDILGYRRLCRMGKNKPRLEPIPFSSYKVCYIFVVRKYPFIVPTCSPLQSGFAEVRKYIVQTCI